MIKKIFFQFIFFNVFFFKEVFATESGGMPQLNTEFWISQIFWLIITFGVLYVVLSKLLLPKISSNLESRKSQIQDNIEAAEKQRESSEAKLKEFDEILLKSKLEAKNIYKEARENAHKKINKIAIETTAELLKKLIGAEVNNSSISAIVEDLSKRNESKYYDN